MKRYLALVLLLAICILTVFFQLGGGYSEAIHSVATHRGLNLQPMVVGDSISSLVALIWGVILTIRAKQWKWMLAILFTTYIGAGIYAIYSLIQEYRQRSEHAKMLLAGR